MPKKSLFWKFIGENIVALSTVLAGLGVIIWIAVSDPSQFDVVAATTLGLLCLLATSELVEGRKRLETIQDSLNENHKKILNLLPVASIQRFPDSSEALEYLDNMIKGAKYSLDFASIDQTRSKSVSSHKKHRDARKAAVKAGNIRFRYLFLANEERNERVKEYLKNAVSGKFFAAGFNIDALSIPMMIFVIVDGEEIFVRSPYELGEEEVYLTMRHPEVIKLFFQYFNRLWDSALKIDPALSYTQQILKIDSLLENIKQ